MNFVVEMKKKNVNAIFGGDGTTDYRHKNTPATNERSFRTNYLPIKACTSAEKKYIDVNA